MQTDAETLLGMAAAIFAAFLVVVAIVVAFRAGRAAGYADGYANGMIDGIDAVSGGLDDDSDFEAPPLDGPEDPDLDDAEYGDPVGGAEGPAVDVEAEAEAPRLKVGDRVRIVRECLALESVFVFGLELESDVGKVGKIVEGFGPDAFMVEVRQASGSSGPFLFRADALELVDEDKAAA